MPIQFCYGELWQQALFKCMFVIAPNVFHVTNCIRKWLEGEVRLHNIFACMQSFRALLPHLSELPHLPGIPRLSVNRPLFQKPLENVT